MDVFVRGHRSKQIDRSPIYRIDESHGGPMKTGVRRVTRANRERMPALGRIIYAGYNKLPALEISTSYGHPNGFIVVDL